MADHAVSLSAAYGTPPLATWVTAVGRKTASLAALGEQLPFDELVAAATAQVRGALEQSA